MQSRTGMRIAGFLAAAVALIGVHSAAAQDSFDDFVLEVPETETVETIRQAKQIIASERGGIDRQGPLFTEAWMFSESGMGQLWCADSDLEGNILFVGTAGVPNGLRVQKLDGAQNVLPSVLWEVSSTYITAPYACATDLDDNIYVASTLR